jgi:hypothetical protein
MAVGSIYPCVSKTDDSILLSGSKLRAISAPERLTKVPCNVAISEDL